MNYGLPYKGSKNKLAERIVSLLPKRTHLIDLFCGGCAIAHAALIKNKYQHIHINDINWMCPTLFIDALNGKYANDTRWISHEDFFRLRHTDPYVAIVWSFSNNMRSYLYSKEIEPLKKAIHYAIFFSDYSLAADLGHDLSFIETIPDVYHKQLAVKRYFKQFGHYENEIVERGGGTGRIGQIAAQRTQYTNVNPSSQTVGGQAKTSIQNATQQRVEQNLSDWKLENEQSAPVPSLNLIGGGIDDSLITKSCVDYAEVPIPEDSVIYCDIPYMNTEGYPRHGGFDYERFYQWAEQQTEPVFISSYWMPPERFDVVAEFNHRCTAAQKVNNKVTERIFIPKNQKERGNILSQPSLYDLLSM